MRILTPNYYHRFRCIASACEDSCCKEWEVDVDPEAAAFYRALPGELGDRLRQVLRDTEDGTCMTIEDRRCPMWRQDGLCRIQAELGHEALCTVCRTFPRLRHDYGDFAELGLELSCPEAARLILADKGGFTITEEPGGEEADYDAEAMEVLLASRAEILNFLTDATYSVPQALAILLLHGYAVQDWLDGGDPVTLDPETTLNDAKKFQKSSDIQQIFDFFKELEILTPQWKARLEAGPQPIQWSETIRALARYMVSRYYLQALSDYDLICRIKLTVIACLLVAALRGDPVEAAQQFSKEIENDPDNVEALLDGAYTASAFTDLQLLSLLLEG